MFTSGAIAVIHTYRIKGQYCTDKRGPAYDSFEIEVRAFSAADALTQLEVEFSDRDLRVYGIEPVEPDAQGGA